ncbi:MAG: phenylacetate--CoA ligase family protein, partial [Deferribacteraceae bacterium]|nr:phenylacetate--CoA ligase family protein [Deferribacteraceae bacterium]
MDEHILDSLKKSIVKAKRSEFYKKHLREVEAGGITSIEAFQAIPFTDKDDLRNAYPFGLLAVDEDSIVRIHSSSGTTGAPVIIPYTMQDVEDWAEMFKRCYETA